MFRALMALLALGAVSSCELAEQAYASPVPTIELAAKRHHVRHVRHVRHHEARAARQSAGIIECNAQGCHNGSQAAYSETTYVPHRSGGHTRSAGSYSDPRPSAWCGWWMRHHLGVADKAFNLARKWASFGSRASGPAVGVLVVWAHHVGIITGETKDGWVVKSGNDGHAVRERVRSLRGAIAFRHPSNHLAMN